MTDAEQRRLVFPVCTAIGVAGSCAFLVDHALDIEAGKTQFDARGHSGRNAVISRLLHGVANALGLIGSIALSAVLVVGLVVWVAMTVRSIRRERALLLQTHGNVNPVIDASPASTALEVLLAAHVRAWRKQFLLGSLLLAAVSIVGGLALFALHSEKGYSSSDAGARGLGLATVSAIFGILGALSTLRDPRGHAVVSRIVRAPRAVVWLYVQRAPEPKPEWLAKLLRSEPFSWLYVGFDDGQLRGMPLMRDHEERVLGALSAEAPGASRGFSAELRDRFARDPRSLRR